MTLPELAGAGLDRPRAGPTPSIPSAPTSPRSASGCGRRSRQAAATCPPATAYSARSSDPSTTSRCSSSVRTPTRRPGHPIGLSFAVDAHVRPLPRSLSNIYQELEADLGIPRAAHGDLSAWSDQGVMLLNRVLTVAPGAPASHRGWGWENVTAHAIRTLVARDAALVAILWGRDASNLRPLLGETPIIESAHPSPLSASRGFFGSRPFSRANELLAQQGAAPVDWRLPGAA